MIMFWIAAALLSAGAASFIVHRSARAVSAATTGGEDPALSVFRRQLGEIDDLTDRGLILPAEQRSARTEAARRLLAAADRGQAEALSPVDGRQLAAVLAAAAAVAGLALYLATGAPQAADAPFSKRLAAWRAADPASLDPARMAAVLGQIVREHPADPQPRSYLAQAELLSGDSVSAEHDLRRAIALAPGRADLWAALGEMIAAGADGPLPDDARQAFRRAAALDPTAPGPRYALARDQIAAGQVNDGLATWRALEAAMPAGDPRRAGLADEIAVVERTGALPKTAPGDAPAQPSGFVRAMVDRLAARLAANPDDPAGWGRLIRSYQVLGDEAHRSAALDQARRLFKNRPDALRVLAAAAGAPP